MGNFSTKIKSLIVHLFFVFLLFSSSQSKSHSCYNLCPFSAFLPADLSGSRQDVVFKGREKEDWMLTLAHMPAA